MAYFFLSGKLLNKASFLGFVSRVYEDFISKDEAEYEQWQAEGRSFTLDLKGWLAKCGDEKTLRMEEEKEVAFKAFALSRIRTLVNMDVDIYVKDFRAGKIRDKEEFIAELGQLKAYISATDYLAPVAEGLQETISQIPPEVTGGPVVGQAPAGDGRQQLRWNGPVEELCAVFGQLIAPGKDGGPARLNYPASTIMEFVFAHFLDGDGRELSKAEIMRYLDKPAAKKGGGTGKGGKSKTD